MLYVKYGKTQLHGFRGDVILGNVDDDRWTDRQRMPAYTVSSTMSLQLRWAKNEGSVRYQLASPNWYNDYLLSIGYICTLCYLDAGIPMSFSLHTWKHLRRHFTASSASVSLKLLSSISTATSLPDRIPKVVMSKLPRSEVWLLVTAWPCRGGNSDKLILHRGYLTW